jgi:hypothetical protein
LTSAREAVLEVALGVEDRAILLEPGHDLGQ